LGKRDRRCARVLSIAAFSLALASPAFGQSPPPAAHWTYEGEHGPAHWGALSRDFEACKLGTHQSPIDIRGAQAAPLPAISFGYEPSPLQLVDNGHTVQATSAPGSFISVGGERYELVQFHFHHPSEERVNGIWYPMVAHLVHRNAGGKLAVVAVLLTEGATNPFIETLWKHLPAEEGKVSAPEGVAIDVAQLLPARRGYYTFTGSLTTPPCSEGVTWFVLKSLVPVSGSQIAAFARKFPHNVRPVQPTNDRVVRMTQ